jgi:hypothetical protein
MSNAKLSTPRSKQLGLALHSRQFPAKNLIAYMEGLLAVSSYVNCTFNSHAKAQGCCGGCRRRCTLGLEPARQQALHGLPQAQAQALGWYREAPRSARKQPVVNADEPAPAADNHEEAT